MQSSSHRPSSYISVHKVSYVYREMISVVFAVGGSSWARRLGLAVFSCIIAMSTEKVQVWAAAARPPANPSGEAIMNQHSNAYKNSNYGGFSKCPGKLMDDGVNFAVTSLGSLEGNQCNYTFPPPAADAEIPRTTYILTSFKCDNDCQGFLVNEHFVLWDSFHHKAMKAPGCPAKSIDSCDHLDTICNIEEYDFTCRPSVKTIDGSVHMGEFVCRSVANIGFWCGGTVEEIEEPQCPPSLIPSSKALTHYCPQGYSLEWTEDKVQKYTCLAGWEGAVCEGTVSDLMPTPNCLRNVTSCSFYDTVCDTSDIHENLCGHEVCLSNTRQDVQEIDQFECWEKATQQWCKGYIEFTKSELDELLESHSEGKAFSEEKMAGPPKEAPAAKNKVLSSAGMWILAVGVAASVTVGMAVIKRQAVLSQWMTYRGLNHQDDIDEGIELEDRGSDEFAIA